MLSARERSERAARIERTRLVDFVSPLARARARTAATSTEVAVVAEEPSGRDVGDEEW